MQLQEFKAKDLLKANSLDPNRTDEFRLRLKVNTKSIRLDLEAKRDQENLK